MSVRHAVLFRFGFCLLFLLLFCVFPFLFYQILLYSSLLSTPSPVSPTPPHHTAFVFAHFYALPFPFWSLYSLFLISLVVAASELIDCFYHAVCLKPWFYCCRTKLKLTWLLGCYLQFISLSAALVKRTLSRYFFHNFSNHFPHCLQ